MSSVVISNRATLKGQFQDGKYLSGKDFATLIESTVNKRTDHFHGVWQQGNSYCPGDVVIHRQQLWMMIGEKCYCADQRPDQDSDYWRVFPHDGDWIAKGDRQVMWAEVFDRVGIGVGSDTEVPQARLDVRKLREDAKQALATDDPPASLLSAGEGRWLAFPQGSTQTQTTLIHYRDLVDTGQPDPTAKPSPSAISYLINGLSLQAATWCTDASQGFSFCWGPSQAQETDVLPLSPNAGETMLVVQPRSLLSRPPAPRTEAPHRHLGSLGLNTAGPQALVELSDPQRGSLRFLPDFAESPTLFLLGTGEEVNAPCASLGVTAQETSLISNAADGFSFYRGQNYGAQPPSPDSVLLKVRQGEQSARPQVGIGTATPIARLDIHAQDDQTQLQLLPEQPEGNAVPAISLFQWSGESSTAELTAAIATRTEATVSGWQTSCDRGFVFQQILPAPVPPPDCQEGAESPAPVDLLQGRTHLAIREQGFVGIGTETPQARLEISRDSGSGQFLFDVDRGPDPTLSIGKPSSAVALVVGTNDTQAVLTANTPEGFWFKALGESDSPDGYLDAGRSLVNIAPEGRVGIGRAPRDYELDVQGTVQARAIYADTNADQICEVKPLFSTLWKLQNLAPITFEWIAESSGFAPTDESVPGNAVTQSNNPEPDSAQAAAPDTEPIADPWTDTSTAPTALSEDTCPSPNRQIGLLAHQVAEHFPQVVKTASDGSQSVAYTSLVPVLVQAINELNRKHHKDVRQLETQIEQQANRIALLAIVIGVWAAIAFLKLLL